MKLYRKLLRTFKTKSYPNYRFENISLGRWCEYLSGDILAISKKRTFNKHIPDASYNLQDAFVKIFPESEEMKRYKYVCAEYCNLLKRCIEADLYAGKQFNELNKLAIQKNELQRQVISKENAGIDELIGSVQSQVSFYLDKKTMLACEFYQLIKTLEKHGKASS